MTTIHRGVKRLSFTGMWFMKYGAPVLWLAMMTALLGVSIFGPEKDRSVGVAMLLLAMLTMGGLNWWVRIRPLADVVDDLGDALLVRVGGREERIAFHAIERVERRSWFGRIELHLASRDEMPKIVLFVPVNGLGIGPNPVLDDLVARVGRARSGASA
jgi:hypothetical protein